MLDSTQKKKPKILMIAPEPFFECRGTPISVYQRIQALSKLGYRIDLLTYFLGKDIDIPGVRIIRTPRIPFIKHIPIGPSWKKAFVDMFIFIGAILLLSNRSYEIIHSHEEASYFALLLASIFRLRHVYDMHSCMPTQVRNSKYGRIFPIVAFFRLLERLTIERADAVITIDTDLEKYIRNIKPDVNSIVIENLPLQSFISEDQKTIKSLREKLRLDGRAPVVYTGSFENYQGIDMLISSAKIINSQFSNAIFILIGGNPSQIQRYKRKIQRERLNDSFIFAGRVPEEESIAYMNLANVLVSPRVSGMSVPLKIYTYLISGKAIVATNIDAHTKVLTSEYALLTEPTSEGFAEGVLKILRDPELGNSLGLRGKLFAIEKYSLSNYLAKVEEIYQTLYPLNNLSPYPDNVVIKG